MPADSKQRSIHSKVATILGVATALWLVWWYCVALASGTGPDRATVQAHAARIAPTGLGTGEAIGYDRDPARMHFEQMSEREMKRFYSRCSREGIERRLDGGEAMACSIGYEVLLRKHFAGDFERLRHWSQQAVEVE